MRNVALLLAAQSFRLGFSAVTLLCLGLATATAQDAVRVGGFERFDFWKGKMSTFGGPKDRGVADDEDLALVFNEKTFNLCRELFLDEQPEDTTGYAKRLNPKTMYIACRWNYKVTPLKILYYSKAKVTNPKTSKSVWARPVDWGPHDDTKRVADLSDGLAKALELETDDLVNVDLYVPHVILVSCHWNTGDDVDLWVEEPKGQKCHAGNRTTKNGGKLNHENSSGFGRGKDNTPEDYSMVKSVPGEYVIKVHYKSGPRGKKKKPTTVTIDVTENAYLPTPKHKTYTTILTEAGQTEEVCRVVIPGKSDEIDYIAVLKETMKRHMLGQKKLLKDADKMLDGSQKYECSFNWRKKDGGGIIIQAYDDNDGAAKGYMGTRKLWEKLELYRAVKLPGADEAGEGLREGDGVYQLHLRVGKAYVGIALEGDKASSGAEVARQYAKTIIEQLSDGGP